MINSLVEELFRIMHSLITEPKEYEKECEQQHS